MALSQAIMTALLEDEMSGYELAHSFESSGLFFWRASHQQIYQDLRKLSDCGFLTSRTQAQRGKPAKILYRLTRAGRDALEAWVTGASRMQPAKDDLLVKLHSASVGNVGHLVGELEQRREETMQCLYFYEKIRRAHYADPESLPVRRKGVYLALAAGISQGEHYLQWCDQALALLATIDVSGDQ